MEDSMLGKGTRSLGPVLALVAGLVAGASCGSSDDAPSEDEAKALCEAACDALNNCDQGCKPAEYGDPCTKAIAGGDKARKAEVECIEKATCEAIGACGGGGDDRCAGVSCQDPQQCDPDSGMCRESDGCVENSQDRECTGNQFCWNTFCKDAYPRTYVFVFHDVQIPGTKPMSTDAWDPDGGGQPDIYARIEKNDKQAARSQTLTDTFESEDFDQQVPGGARLEVQINEGDKVVFGFWDEDAGADEYILGCSIDDSTTTADEFPGSLRTPGINCRDTEGNGFQITIEPR